MVIHTQNMTSKAQKPLNVYEEKNQKKLSKFHHIVMLGGAIESNVNITEEGTPIIKCQEMISVLLVKKNASLKNANANTIDFAKGEAVE